jgi:hypothetical protein
MKTNLLAAAVALSDEDLLAGLHTLARTERESTAELIAHLTALELRPSLYLADGYGSLFDYCTRCLELSEDAACTRTNVVRACRRFPVILDHLFVGALTLTAVRLLVPHLTAENHEAVLARAKGRRKDDIEALIAELAPRPDVPSSVRALPEPKAAYSVWAVSASEPPTAPASAASIPKEPSVSVASGATTAGDTSHEAVPIDHDDVEDRFVFPAPSPSFPSTVRSSERCPRSVTESSSRSARRPTTISGWSRRCCGVSSRAVIRAQSSHAPSPCSARMSRRPSSARFPNRGGHAPTAGLKAALTTIESVSGRMRTRGRTRHHRGTRHRHGMSGLHRRFQASAAPG